VYNQVSKGLDNALLSKYKAAASCKSKMIQNFEKSEACPGKTWEARNLKN
jgi:hypothetical protein